MNRGMVSVACAAALVLALTPKVALASPAEPHHQLSKSSVIAVNMYVGADAPDALIAAATPAISSPVVLRWLIRDHDVPFRTGRGQAVLHDRAPPRR